MALIVDSHQHFWELARFDYSWLDRPRLGPIRRDYLPADLKPLLDAAGIDRTVLVQTQHNLDENRWALDLAERHAWIAGVVGWVDLGSPQCDEQLQKFIGHPKFVGVRHIVQDEPDDDFILRDDVLGGLKVLEAHGVPYDLLFYEKHVDRAAAVARRLPGLPLVIDHLAKPLIKSGQLDRWRRHLRLAAEHANVYCKLSGMITEADWQRWKPDDLRPYVETALEAFGPERLMFGSDWPVCLLAGSYQQVVDALRDALGPLSADEQARIFGGTAARFYKLRL